MFHTELLTKFDHVRASLPQLAQTNTQLDLIQLSTGHILLPLQMMVMMTVVMRVMRMIMIMTNGDDYGIE